MLDVYESGSRCAWIGLHNDFEQRRANVGLWLSTVDGQLGIYKWWELVCPCYDKKVSSRTAFDIVYEVGPVNEWLLGGRRTSDLVQGVQ